MGAGAVVVTGPLTSICFPQERHKKRSLFLPARKIFHSQLVSAIRDQVEVIGLLHRQDIISGKAKG